MAVVTSDLLNGTLTNFRALFRGSLRDAMKNISWNQFTVPVDSNNLIEDYSWFGYGPRMQDITSGSLKFDDVEHFNYTIRNKKFGAGIEVDEDIFLFDRLRQVRPRIEDLAGEAASHPGQLIMELFETPGNAFDGTAFFANSRTIGDSANIDNLLAGSGITVANLQTDLAEARGAMMTFQDEKGRPTNLIGDTVVCHPSLQQTFFQALNTNQGDGVVSPALPASANGMVTASGYKLIANPYLTDATDWYFLHTRGAKRPFVLQTLQAPQMVSSTNPNNPEVIRTGKYLYAVKAWYNAGVVDPRYAIQIVNS